jgi:hypothetical protein
VPRSKASTRMSRSDKAGIHRSLHTASTALSLIVTQ